MKALGKKHAEKMLRESMYCAEEFGGGREMQLQNMVGGKADPSRVRTGKFISGDDHSSTVAVTTLNFTRCCLFLCACAYVNNNIAISIKKTRASLQM